MILHIFLDWLIGSVVALVMLALATFAFYAAYFLFNLALGVSVILAIPLFILTGWSTLVGFFLSVLGLFTLLGET